MEMEVTGVIAGNAKRFREQRKLTLDAAAALTGVSRSMLAQIEKGDVNPTVSVLWKIANGYKVPFTSLVERHGEAVSVLRQEEVAPLTEDGGRYRNYPVFAFDEGKQFELYRIGVEPGGNLDAQPHLGGTEEYITIFRGQLEIKVDRQAYQLNCGDSIRFRADVPHAYRNPGEERAEMSMLIYYDR